ncbi:MAG: hypothetical protein ACTSQA_06070 [Candidatus Heimdallarchaeaceae archaeon]
MNKYKYLKVIQQRYSAYYGWEDVSEYDMNEAGWRKHWKYDVGEYRLMGYPTRSIERREANGR